MSSSGNTIAVIGAGSWGTALAIQLAATHQVRLWGHDPAEIRQLQLDGENKQYLPGIKFPSQLQPEVDLKTTLSDASEVLLVVPSHAFASACQQIAQINPSLASLSWATKGFDPSSNTLLSDVAKHYFPDTDLAVISGPTFAREVAIGMPTAVTVASDHLEHAQRVANYLRGKSFRAYTSDDMIGVQVGGACKNVMAIAAGISDGLGFGANARAALITRGLSEITRLGLALGGKAETFMGLAGLGDLSLTCTDNQSRNRRMGLALARGLSIAEAKIEIGQEVEGINTAREVYTKAHALGVEMPITDQTYRVLHESLDPKRAVNNLLERQAGNE